MNSAPSRRCLAVFVAIAAVGFALIAQPVLSLAADDDEAMPDPLCRVYATAPGATWAASGMLPFAEFVSRLTPADVVILGEYHDDPASHAMELALLERLAASRTALVLSMEMFERDVQSVLDNYLAGGMTEDEFLAQSRPWGNYPTDYRPLIEFAKAHGIKVVAANTPTELARRIAREGIDAALAGMTPTERGWLAANTSAPDDMYWENFKLQMGGGGHGGMQMDEAMVRSFYQSQCMKDDTMAESIVRALLGGAPVATAAGEGAVERPHVLHVTGSFHCDYKLGTAARVIQRLAGPLSVAAAAPAEGKAELGSASGRVIVVAMRPVQGWSQAGLRAEGVYVDYTGADGAVQSVPVGDFVVFVPAPDFGQAIRAVPPTPEPEAAAEDEMTMPPMPPAPGAPAAPAPGAPAMLPAPPAMPPSS